MGIDAVSRSDSATNGDARTRRIVADRDIPSVEFAFRGLGEVQLVDGRSIGRVDVADADVLIVRSVTKIDAQLLDGSNVSTVATATSGLDHLDLDYLKTREITVFDAAGCNARAVAEHVVVCSSLLAIRDARQFAKTSVGIVGYGHVGQAVHRLFASLGVRCLVNDPPRAARDSDTDYCDLEKILECDIVTLHVPYTTTGNYPTHHLIGASELRALRSEATLINAARGGVIEERSLIDWLRSGPPKSVAIDCWQGEPTVNLELLRLVTMATPHIAGHTQKARQTATRMLSHQLAQALDSSTRWQPAAIEKIDCALASGNSETEMELLRDAMLRCYDPRVLSQEMQRCLSLPRTKRATRFDELRQHAGVRNEFGAFRVASNALQLDTVEKLSGLGFELI